MVGSFVRFFFTSCKRRERTSERSERVSSATPRNEWRKIGQTNQPWSNLYVFLLPLDGMLVHHRVTPSIEFTGTHWFAWVERGTVRVKCLAQEHNPMSQARARTWSLNLETSALTMRPLHLSLISMHLSNFAMLESRPTNWWLSWSLCCYPKYLCTICTKPLEVKCQSISFINISFTSWLTLHWYWVIMETFYETLS